MQEQQSVLSISSLQHTIDPASDVDARVDAVTKLQAEFERGMQVTTIFPASDAQSLSFDLSDQRPRRPYQRSQSMFTHIQPTFDCRCSGHCPHFYHFSSHPLSLEHPQRNPHRTIRCSQSIRSHYARSSLHSFLLAVLLIVWETIGRKSDTMHARLSSFLVAWRSGLAYQA